MKHKKITEFLTVTLLLSLGLSQTYTVQASSSKDTKVAKNISMTILIKRKQKI